MARSNYDITHDRPALQVIQASKIQIDKQIKHKLKFLKLLDYKTHTHTQDSESTLNNRFYDVSITGNST